MALLTQLSTPAILLLHPPQQQTGWRFDLPSAIVGFVLGLLVGLGIYLLRHRITAARDAIRDRALHVRQRVSTGVEDRYREQVIETAERRHVLHRYTELSTLYVQRRLIVPDAVPADLRPPEDEAESGRWQEMRLHDVLHPSPVTVEIADALRQYKKLAILGPMGTGRTTLLDYLTQLYGRRAGWRLTYPEPTEEDEKSLIAEREWERERLPVHISLPLVDLDLAEGGGRHVFVEPLTDCVASTLGGLIALPSAPMVRTKVIAGNALLLFDNLDMLDDNTRRRALEWIDQLARAYPTNIVIVAGGAEGYQALWRIGFATLMLNAFDQRETGRFVERWQGLREGLDVERWQSEAAELQAAFDTAVDRARREGRPPPNEADYSPPPVPEPAPPLLDVWPEGRQERVRPVDLALAARLWREQDAVPAVDLIRYVQSAVAAFRGAQDGLLTPPQWARVISSVTWDMQREGGYSLGRERFEGAITELLDEAYMASADMRHRVEGEEDEKPDFGRQGRMAFAALLGTGDLMRDVGRGRVAFVHPVFRAYFAAQYAARTNLADTMREHVRDAGWQDTLLFYAALTNAAPLVMARLKGEDDLFRSNFFAAAGYLAVSPEADKRLQGGVLAELAQVVMDPTKPTLLCRRAASAIAHSKDKGAIYLFGQAMQHEDPHVRRLGVWGLSQMEDERVLPGLKHALGDVDRLVRVEVLHALASIGGDVAIDGLVQGLQDEDELARRVSAELLAAMGGEGNNLLREAVQHDDMYFRRAAVFGLGVVGEPWALAIVDEMRREDDEWFVRSAATEVMDRVSGPQAVVAPGPPPIEGHDWLVRWASQRGVTLSSTEDAQRMLTQALQQEDWTIKMAAADTLRVSGTQSVIPALKSAIADENLLVREAAFAALQEIAVRTGTRIEA